MVKHDCMKETEREILSLALRIQNKKVYMLDPCILTLFLGRVSVHTVGQLKYAPFKTCENHLPNMVTKTITIVNRRNINVGRALAANTKILISVDSVKILT